MLSLASAMGLTATIYESRGVRLLTCFLFFFFFLTLICAFFFFVAQLSCRVKVRPLPSCLNQKRIR